jgi:2-polyprenyl-3-methyl-5-hydroxy-6-metoxy-1,4-benzoquinol methylase
MRSCCDTSNACTGVNRFFSRRSKHYARRFGKKGLERAQQYLIEGVRRMPISAKEVLDIGCGVGALHLTLLNQGAARSLGVEMSEGMIAEAKRLASESGVEERTQYIVGDFVELADSLAESDITLLDKVVCCYERLDDLIEKSTARTKSIYALSHPKDNALMKTVFRTQILLARFLGWSFHPFWHDWVEMKNLIASRGFQLLYENSTIAWQVLVFQRI